MKWVSQRPVLQVWPLSYALKLSFSLPSSQAGCERVFISLPFGLVLSIVEFYPIAFGACLARLDLFQISKPADDMFRIDVFEALLYKDAHVSLKCVISF